MRKEIKILGVIAIVVVIAAAIGAAYYRSSVQNTRITPAANANKPQTANTATVPSEQLIRPDSPSLGPADARVTLVEFYDPECESCAQFAPIVKSILKENEGKIRLITRYMPLHPNSWKAAAFIEAAGEQGKYWEAQSMLLERQPEWGTKHGPATDDPAPDISILFDKYAKELGLDTAKASAAIKSNKFSPKIELDNNDGMSLGVRRTPTFFVNGRQLAKFGEQELRALISEEMGKGGS